MHRCSCCLYRTGGVLSRGRRGRLPNISFGNAWPARVGIPTGKVPDTPIPRPRFGIKSLAVPLCTSMCCFRSQRRALGGGPSGHCGTNPSVAPLFVRLWGSCAGFGVGRKSEETPIWLRASYSSTRTTSRDMRNELARRVRTPGYWPLPERRLFITTFSNRARHI